MILLEPCLATGSGGTAQGETMHWNYSNRTTRGIATLFLAFGLSATAQTGPIRLSAPALGWLLSPDGTQVIAITGVMDSPRDGSTLRLPATASRIWTSPEGDRLIASTTEGAYMISASGSAVRLTEGPNISAAWSRDGGLVAVCAPESCAGFDKSGRGSFNLSLPEGASLAALHSESVYAFRKGNTLTVRSGDTEFTVEGGIAVQFTPARGEAWILSEDGTLQSRDRMGNAGAKHEFVPRPAGLAVSADGGQLVAVNAEGAMAVFEVATQTVQRLEIETGAEGVWSAPGNLNVRLHESAKRPVAFWSVETNRLGWMPAVAVEVAQ